MDIERLYRAVKMAWEEDTAAGEWREEVPSMNQCAVTSLVVQDYLGGTLQRQLLNDGDSHYWNRLPNGMDVDMTAEQFNYTKQYREGPVVIREREYVLGYPDTLKRYELLRDRVKKILNL